MRGRRPPVTYAAPVPATAAREPRQDRNSATPHSDDAGAVQPGGLEKMLLARVTDVIDPTSFWAQVGEGRRAICLLPAFRHS